MSPPVPLDDFSPSVRAAVLKLRGQDLDPGDREALAEVMWAVAMPTLLAHMDTVIAKRMEAQEATWRAHVAKLRAEIERLGALQHGA